MAISCRNNKGQETAKVTMLKMHILTPRPTILLQKNPSVWEMLGLNGFQVMEAMLQNSTKWFTFWVCCGRVSSVQLQTSIYAS